MAISDLYTSGRHKQEIGHFANIVKIAKADGEMSEAEKELLNSFITNFF
jgi:tellurite resistance protein